MNSSPWIVYLVLAGVSLVQALLLALQAWEHRRYARSCLRDVAGQRPRGRAMILAPCKGAELRAGGEPPRAAPAGLRRL